MTGRDLSPSWFLGGMAVGTPRFPRWPRLEGIGGSVGAGSQKSGRPEVRWERMELVPDMPVAPERSCPVSWQTEAFLGGGCMAPVWQTGSPFLAGEPW